VKVVFTAQNVEKGKGASQDLISLDLDVVFHPLDVTSTESIERNGNGCVAGLDGKHAYR